MTLKIEMYPAFMNECLFELKCETNTCRLIVVQSSLPERGLRGAAFNEAIQETETIDDLKEMLFRFVEHPTPKRTVTIADGISFKINYISESRTFHCHLSSIQDHSIELDFVDLLFQISNSSISEPNFQLYLQEVKKEFLS